MIGHLFNGVFDFVRVAAPPPGHLDPHPAGTRKLKRPSSQETPGDPLLDIDDADVLDPNGADISGGHPFPVFSPSFLDGIAIRISPVPHDGQQQQQQGGHAQGKGVVIIRQRKTKLGRSRPHAAVEHHMRQW